MNENCCPSTFAFILLHNGINKVFLATVLITARKMIKISFCKLQNLMTKRDSRLIRQIISD